MDYGWHSFAGAKNLYHNPATVDFWIYAAVTQELNLKSFTFDVACHGPWLIDLDEASRSE